MEALDHLGSAIASDRSLDSEDLLWLSAALITVGVAKNPDTSPERASEDVLLGGASHPRCGAL